jgi:hypothetical protein
VTLKVLLFSLIGGRIETDRVSECLVTDLEWLFEERARARSWEEREANGVEEDYS